MKKIGEIVTDYRFWVCVVADAVDFFLPPGFESALDVIMTLTAYLFFGWPGIIAGWEILEFTSVVDRFIPTLTIIYLNREAGLNISRLFGRNELPEPGKK